MSGNVFEWTQDWYMVYPPGDATDPEGPQSGSIRIYRGGAWYWDVSRAPVSSRSGGATSAYNYVGFRLARSIVP